MSRVLNVLSEVIWSRKKRVRRASARLYAYTFKNSTLGSAVYASVSVGRPLTS